ncbi:MAG: sigma-70 family RNA polymerase sigma factor, partial [Planctomycetes bacterium]|nr:sigma-70 family RNA polymerase sigma factor [Planctomycetota bacterium]
MLSRTSTTLLAGLEDPHNEAAWRRFYARYTPMLLSYAKRVGLADADAQDAVADTLATFVQAYRRGRYDRQRARLKSWLGGIARNKVRKLWARRRTASLEASLARAEGCPCEPAGDGKPDEAFEREWQLETLGTALETLRHEADPNAYQAFDLYAMKNWPVGKVAALLSMSTNAIYIHKCRML